MKRFLRMLDNLMFNLVRFALFMFMVLSFLNAIILTTHVVKPYKPFIRLSDNEIFGHYDYLKGVPVQMSANVLLPDTNYKWKQVLADGSFQGGERQVFYANPMPSNDPLHRAGLGKLTYADTITTTFHDANNFFKANPIVRAATINGFILYLWADDMGERFKHFAPILLLLLTYTISCGLLLRYMGISSKDEEFRQRNYRKIAWLGLTIIAYQLAMFYLSGTETFNHEYRVQIQATIDNYRMPFDLYGKPEKPFSLPWLVLGFLILVISRSHKKGRSFHYDSVETI